MASYDIAKLGFDLKGSKISIDLAPLVVFVGDERSGKSTYLEAVRLAVTGGLASKEEAWQDYVTAGSTEIYARARNERGDVAFSFSLPIENGKAKPRARQHKHKGVPDGVHLIPAVALASLVEGGASLERAIMRRYGGETLDIPETVADTIAEIWPEASGAPVFSAAGAPEVERKIHSEVNNLGRRAGDLERRIQGIRVASGIKAQIDALEAKVSRYSKALEDYEEGEEWRAYASEEDASGAEDCEARAAALDDEVASLEARVAFHRGLHGIAKRFLAKGQKGKLDCPICKIGHLNPETVKEKTAKSIATSRSKIDQKRREADGLRKKARDLRWGEVPDIAELNRKLAELAASREAVNRKGEMESEVAGLRRKQEDLKFAKAKLQQAAGSTRNAALAKAALDVGRVSIPGFDISLRSKGPQWLVDTPHGPKAYSLSGSERLAIMLAVPLAFADPEVPPIVLLDDEDFVGLSSAGVTRMLEKFAELQRDGRVSQVLITRHTDRAGEVPDGYERIDV